MAQLIKIKSGSSGAAPASLLTGEPAYSINDNKLYIGNGSSVVRVDAGSYTGECSTAAATGAKTVSCAGFILFKGVEITVKFTVTNTAAVSGLTLNVGGTGAKPIRYRGTYLLSPSTLSKNRVYKFYYGGDYWELIGDLDIDTTVATELASHTDNSEIHITSTERTNWNAAYSWGNHASAGYAAASALSSHTGNTSNPHSVTKSQVGLGNVNNTSDANKPVSTAMQTALNLKANLASPTFTGNVTAPTFIGALSGNASTATALTSNAGSSTNPIYFSSGKPKASTYSFGNASGNIPISNGTLNTNLNADLLDGKHYSDVLQAIEVAKSTNHGYRYSYNLWIYGDHDKYYPFVLAGGDQNVKRDILIKRSYNETHPAEWYSATHGGGLTLKLKANFGRWGGANYGWEVHELEEMYNPTFGGCYHTTSYMSFSIMLRGGGTGGAIYHIYSDQPIEAIHSLHLNGDGNTSSLFPQVFYNSDVLNYGTSTYTWAMPSPLTTPNVEDIRRRKFIKLVQDIDTLVGKTTGISSLNITGNASTATKLQTARDINGTSFNGTANIITARWGTARNISIGGTTKSVNGSANVTWATSEIAAQSAIQLATTRTIWGQSFNGSANVTGNISNTGNITPLATAAHNIGTSSLMYEKAYIRRIDTQSGYNLRLNVAGSEYMTIDTSGNVGIGTTSPAYKLDVSGTGRFSSTLSADRIVVTSTSNVKHLEFSRSDYNYITSKGHIGFITGGTGTSSANQQVWIHSNGNTKIGAGSSSVPAYTLDVNGTGRFSSNLSVGGTLGVTGASTLSSARITSAIYFGSSGTDFQINSSGSAKLYDTWVYNLSVKDAKPFINFHFGNASQVTSRIIEQATGVLDVIGSVKIPDSKYFQIGDARLTYVIDGGVGFLKLAHSNDTTPMHLVTTGGQTMYSEGVPASGDDGGSGTLVYLNGSLVASETASIYAPTTAGSSNNILKSNGSGEPSWVNITSLIPWGGSGSSTMVSRSDHNHGVVYAAYSHTHAISQIYNFPTSMPASDVYAWAKEAAKPTYSYSEISATPTALKNPYSITLQAAGTSLGSYDGSSAKTFNITLTNIGAAAASHNHTGVYAPASHTHSYVPTTRTVNNRELSSNITLSPQDVGAAAAGHTHSYLPLSGGTVTGSLSVNTLSITNTSAASHLAFGRGSYNYITMPASGLLGILPNGQSVGAGSGMWFSSSGLHPGTNNTFMVGTSSKRFSQVHATTIYEAGTALSSKYAASSHTHSYVPTTRKVNTKALSSDITLSHTDVGAAAASHTHSGYAAANHEHETITGILAVGKGGTGATTPAGALNKLGAAAASHTHSGYASTSHDHNGVYAAASHGHATLFYTELRYTDSYSDTHNVLSYSGTSNYDIMLGNDSYKTIINGSPIVLDPFISYTGLVKCTNGTLSIDTNTYALSSHNHTGVYAPITHSHNYLSSVAANMTDVKIGNVNGLGIRFWDQDEYKIFMSQATDVSYGGRILGETTSDYNMYFRFGTHGVNRGFVFESSHGVKLASINPDGFRTTLPFIIRSTNTSYDNSRFTLGNATLKYLAASDNIEINKGLAFTGGTLRGAVVENYGVCSTAESTGAKTVTISGFRLATGVSVYIKFSNNNYAYPITLNVSNTGAKTVKAYGDNDEQYFLEQIQAGAIVPFVYDGTYWVIPTTPSMY